MPVMSWAIMLATAIAISACALGNAVDYQRTPSVVGDQTLEMELADCKIKVSEKTSPGIALDLLTSSERVESCMVARG